MTVEKLVDLKGVITVVYAKMVAENPLRSNLIFYLVDTTKKSLLKFLEAYVEFEQIIGGDEELYAHWLNVQLQVMTLLDNNPKALVLLATTVKDTLKETPGGMHADIFKEANRNKDQINTRSVQIALAFRVYLDDIDVVAEAEPPVPVKPGAGGKA